MEERRRFTRFDLTADIKYKVSKKMREGTSRGKDFSRDGIGIYIDQRIPIGAMVELEINIPGELAPIFATGKMVWFRETENSAAGVKLLKISSFDKSRILNYAHASLKKA